MQDDIWPSLFQESEARNGLPKSTEGNVNDVGGVEAPFTKQVQRLEALMKNSAKYFGSLGQTNPHSYGDDEEDSWDSDDGESLQKELEFTDQVHRLEGMMNNPANGLSAVGRTNSDDISWDSDGREDLQKELALVDGSLFGPNANTHSIATIVTLPERPRQLNDKEMKDGWSPSGSTVDASDDDNSTGFDTINSVTIQRKMQELKDGWSSSGWTLDDSDDMSQGTDTIISEKIPDISAKAHVLSSNSSSVGSTDYQSSQDDGENELQKELDAVDAMFFTLHDPCTTIAVSLSQYKQEAMNEKSAAVDSDDSSFAIQSESTASIAPPQYIKKESFKRVDEDTLKICSDRISSNIQTEPAESIVPPQNLGKGLYKGEEQNILELCAEKPTIAPQTQLTAKIETPQNLQREDCKGIGKELHNVSLNGVVFGAHPNPTARTKSSLHKQEEEFQGAIEEYKSSSVDDISFTANAESWGRIELMVPAEECKMHRLDSAYDAQLDVHTRSTRDKPSLIQITPLQQHQNQKFKQCQSKSTEDTPGSMYDQSIEIEARVPRNPSRQQQLEQEYEHRQSGPSDDTPSTTHLQTTKEIASLPQNQPHSQNHSNHQILDSAEHESVDAHDASTPNIAPSSRCQAYVYKHGNDQTGLRDESTVVVHSVQQGDAFMVQNDESIGETLALPQDGSPKLRRQELQEQVYGQFQSLSAIDTSATGHKNSAASTVVSPQQQLHEEKATCHQVIPAAYVPTVEIDSPTTYLGSLSHHDQKQEKQVIVIDDALPNVGVLRSSRLESMVQHDQQHGECDGSPSLSIDDSSEGVYDPLTARYSRVVPQNKENGNGVVPSGALKSMVHAPPISIEVSLTQQHQQDHDEVHKSCQTTETAFVDSGSEEEASQGILEQTHTFHSGGDSHGERKGFQHSPVPHSISQFWSKPDRMQVTPISPLAYGIFETSKDCGKRASFTKVLCALTLNMPNRPESDDGGRLAPDETTKTDRHQNDLDSDDDELTDGQKANVINATNVDQNTSIAVKNGGSVIYVTERTDATDSTAGSTVNDVAAIETDDGNNISETEEKPPLVTTEAILDRDNSWLSGVVEINDVGDDPNIVADVLCSGCEDNFVRTGLRKESKPGNDLSDGKETKAIDNDHNTTDMEVGLIAGNPACRPASPSEGEYVGSALRAPVGEEVDITLGDHVGATGGSKVLATGDSVNDAYVVDSATNTSAGNSSCDDTTTPGNPVVLDSDCDISDPVGRDKEIIFATSVRKTICSTSHANNTTDATTIENCCAASNQVTHDDEVTFATSEPKVINTFGRVNNTNKAAAMTIKKYFNLVRYVILLILTANYVLLCWISVEFPSEHKEESGLCFENNIIAEISVEREAEVIQPPTDTSTTLPRSKERRPDVCKNTIGLIGEYEEIEAACLFLR